MPRPVHLEALGFTIDRPGPGEDPLWFDGIKDADPNRVWTVIELGNPRAHWRVVPGVRLVNRLGFIITKQPHTEKHESMDIMLDGLPAC